jgi:hypothetical protein
MNPEMEFLEMELAWVRSVRKGRKLAVVPAALEREIAIEGRIAELSDASGQGGLRLAVNFSTRSEDPEQKPAHPKE